MAYAALISLGNTIDSILNHHLFSISPEEKQQIIFLLQHASSFQDSLEEFPEKFNCLEGQIRELALEAEDILEIRVFVRVSSSSDVQQELQLEGVMREIDLIAREMEKIKGRSSSKGANSYARSSSSNASPSPIRKDAVVGFEDHVLHLKERLCGGQSKLQVIPICGMGGIGKTTLAKSVYDDPLIKETFDIRVWVTISQDYSPQRILSSLLHSLKEFNTGKLGKTDEEKVRKILKSRKYLVVMDDIWSIKAWDVVRNVFPDDDNESRVLLTTRLFDVASYPDSSNMICEMQLMDADTSWILFKQKVFGNGDCPSELENIGKEIARSCNGLPLAIMVIAGAASTVNRNLDSWQQIAQNIKSVQQHQIEEILALSYFHLPQYLRSCFLHMSYFPEDYEINVKKLVRLWIAEGFLKSPEDPNNYEKMAEEYLEELVKRNLVLVTKRKWDGRIKSCGLHDVMRDLCIRKAHESKFLLNLMDRSIEKDSFVEIIKKQHREDFDSWKTMNMSSICAFGFGCWRGRWIEFVKSVRLPRVLDAEYGYINLYPLAKKLVELYHLRYLSLRDHSLFDKDLSRFQNLQTLIIGEKKTRIGTVKDFDLWLVWCMPQLRHIYFYGTICFVEETACSFGSLQTLFSLSYLSCTKMIMKKIPNLKKLKVDCSGALLRGIVACLNNLVHLHQLESLEVYGGGNRFPSRPKFYNLSFPVMLKKLIFRNLAFPWHDIAVVGSLPNLQVLKLKDCTCVGGTWATREGGFPQLEFLLIRNCDFKNWITESSHFPRLIRLLLHSCSNLSEIPLDIGEIPTLELIEIKSEVKRSLWKSVKEIQKEQEDSGNDTLQVIFITKSSGFEDFI